MARLDSFRSTIPLHAACIAFMLAVSYAATEGIDVCPANSPHKALPFLKGAKPGVLSSLFGTSGKFSVNTDAITTLVKKTLVPMIGANVFFFALAGLFFIIFILWRLLRFCCFMICCKGTCDAKRENNSVFELLFSRRTKILKGFMFLFGLVAIIFAIYGMASVGKQKEIVRPAFGVIDTLTNYFDEVNGDVNSLMTTINGVDDIITQFQEIITDDVNVDKLVSTLQAIRAFLAYQPGPAAINTEITDLGTKFTTFQSSASLSAFTTSVNTLAATDRSTLNGHLTTLANAQNKLADMKTGTSGADTVWDKLSQVSPTTWTDATGPGSGTPEFNKLTDLNVALTNFADASWSTDLTAIGNALSYVDNFSTTPYTDLNTKAIAVKTELKVVTDAIDQLIGDIQSLKAANNNVQGHLTYLTTQLQYISTDIMSVSFMDTAMARLQSAQSTSADVFVGSGGPSPADDAIASLTTFKAGLSTLATSLDDLITALDAPSKMSTSFADALAYKAWVDGIKSSLGDASIANFKSALSTYLSTPSAASWSAIQSGYTAFNAVMTVLEDSTHFGSTMLSASGDVQTFAAAATAISTADTNLDIKAGAAKTQLTVVAGQSMPALGVTTQLAAAATAFDPTVVDDPITQLQKIKSDVVSAGDDAKAKVKEGTDGVQDSVNKMKDMLVGKVTNVKDDYEPMAAKYDGYRYQGSMALYGLSILFVSLVLMSAFLNYHFGANFSVFALLIITVLYFLLALLIALLISMLYLGCGELEPLILQFAPADLAPVVSYYFANEGSDLKSVLKTAGLVDVDTVIDQVKDSQDNILSSLSGGDITFKTKPLAVLGKINGTITGVETGVNALLTTLGRDGLMPVYGEVKGLVCCMVPDFMSSMWIGLTFAGVFAFALIFCTFFFIGKLDKTPRKDCFGCTCHTYGKYAGTAFPDTLPQFQTPGFDNPLGPYDAPAPNGAIYGEGVVLVNAPVGSGKGKGFDA